MNRRIKRSFAHGIAWNFAGAGIPLVFAFVAIPRLLAGYGSGRFGFLAIVWSLIGYFSIFDFGIGRALTKLVADRIGGNNTHEVPDIAATALRAMMVLGVLAAVVIELTAPWLVGLLKIDAALFGEAVASLRVLGVSVPCVILSAGLIGLLEAHGEFQSINLIRLTMGLLNFAAPLVMLHWSNSLVPATISLALARFITTILYYGKVRELDTVSASRGRFQKSHIKELLSFGGWITVSNLISPLMAQLDKVVVGSVVALSLLPLYSVPADLVNRFSFAPIAMIGVFFPAFATMWAAGNAEAVPAMYADASRSMCAALVPAALCVYAFAPEGLALWMGHDFSAHATPLLRWLAVGLLINSVARVPHALLQAIGRPFTTAKLHMLELPFYVLALWLLLSHFGILGAAMAWTGRMVLDFLLLTLGAYAAVPRLGRKAAQSVYAVGIGVALMLGSAHLSTNVLKIVFCAGISAIGAICAIKTVNQINRHD